jgi:hypothetical protein
MTTDALAIGESVEPMASDAAASGLTQSKLHREYITRLTNERDLKVVITAASETGVGKTTLAFALASIWDIHGFTPGKATLNPKRFETLYDDCPPGSVLILDEAEQALDSRDSMTNENKNIGQKFAECRYGQIVSILTLPSIGWLDKRIREDVADYWIECLEGEDGKPKGEARVYKLDKDDHRGKTMTYKTEIVSWPILDYIDEFRLLERKKDRHTRGETSSKYVTQEEHQEKMRKLRQNLGREIRNDFIVALDSTALNQQEIADVTAAVGKRNKSVDGLSRSHVSRVKNEVET